MNRIDAQTRGFFRVACFLEHSPLAIYATHPETYALMSRSGGFAFNFTSLVSVEVPARRLVPTRRPVLFLARAAAISGGLALRANFEVLQKAHNLAPVVPAIRRPLQRFSAYRLEPGEYIIMPPPSATNVPR